MSINNENNNDNESQLNLRQQSRTELKKFSAKSLTDLEPSKNAHIAFNLELIDQDIKPIICKMKSLAYNFKDKVKRTLAEQEAARIIRKILSKWALALRVFHKQDGSIRITKY